MRSMLVGMMAAPAYTPSAAHVWFDPSDLNSLRAEITGAAATTAVSDGDLFGSMLNKGTIGGWATSTLSVTRPNVAQSGGVRYAKRQSYPDINLALPGAIVSALNGANFVMTYGCYVEETGTILSGIDAEANKGLHTGVAGGGHVRFANFGNGLDTSSDDRAANMVITVAQTSTGRYIRKNGVLVASDASSTASTNTAIRLLSGFLGSNDREVRLHNLTINIGGSISDSVRNANEQFVAGKVGISFTST